MSILVDYDPTWPERCQRAAAEMSAVGPPDWVIEHIGSTSVPGLTAKPIIDLAVRVGSFAELDEYQSALRGIGWHPIAAGPRTHRVLVRVNGPDRTHIAHFFTPDQWDACNQRIFRDWLRAHPDDRTRYEAVKIAAAQESSGREYTERKTAIVQEIVDRARTGRGLPPVDVWDK